MIKTSDIDIVQESIQYDSQLLRSLFDVHFLALLVVGSYPYLGKSSILFQFMFCLEPLKNRDQHVDNFDFQMAIVLLVGLYPQHLLCLVYSVIGYHHHNGFLNHQVEDLHLYLVLVEFIDCFLQSVEDSLVVNYFMQKHLVFHLSFFAIILHISSTIYFFLFRICLKNSSYSLIQLYYNQLKLY